MQYVIWTNPGGGLCNMDRCYKWQYLYKVLGKCFIAYIYRNIVQYCTITVYEYDAICIGKLAHAFWVRVSFPEVQSLREAGRTDAVGVFVSALFKRTATITQEKPFLQYFLKCIQNMTFSLGVMFAVTKRTYVRKLGMLSQNLTATSRFNFAKEIQTYGSCSVFLPFKFFSHSVKQFLLL